MTLDALQHRWTITVKRYGHGLRPWAAFVTEGVGKWDGCFHGRTAEAAARKALCAAAASAIGEHRTQFNARIEIDDDWTGRV